MFDVIQILCLICLHGLERNNFYVGNIELLIQTGPYVCQFVTCFSTVAGTHRKSNIYFDLFQINLKIFKQFFDVLMYGRVQYLATFQSRQ